MLAMNALQKFGSLLYIQSIPSNVRHFEPLRGIETPNYTRNDAEALHCANKRKMFRMDNKIAATGIPKTIMHNFYHCLSPHCFRIKAAYQDRYQEMACLALCIRIKLQTICNKK